MPIQQMLLGTGAVATKTYMDDLFSTYLYKGNNSANTLNTGLDMSGEGGLLWVKSRSNRSHQWFDTVRGVNKHIHSDTTAAEVTTSAMNQTFTSTGFTFNNTYTDLNDINGNYASWSFRKSPGFCDIVSYTGNANARTISHSLGSVPGLIIIKNLDTTDHWRVYHRSLGASQTINLNTSSTAGSGNAYFNNTEPTASVFSVGTSESTNKLNSNFIAYLFAGGESTAATARSVDFDGNDWLKVPASSDFNIGTGDFCFEGWYFPQHSNSNGFSGSDDTLVAVNDGGFELYKSGSTLKVRQAGTSNVQLTSSHLPEKTQWTHIAVTRSGTAMKMFFNGTQVASASSSASYTAGSNPNDLYIGNFNYPFTGKISNVRLVNGSAVYTSSFRPPYEPLTNITNTKLLFCNNSSVTGSTVSPTTIVVGSGDPTASTDSPFDDPAGFKFGDAGDQNVIKCGVHRGTGNLNEEIYLGWEPQYVLIKNANNAHGYWDIFDSMRGILTGGNDGDVFLAANANDGESDRGYLDLTSTGFKLQESYSNSDQVIWMAIRRSDGYVGKPPELGTGVFSLNSGANSGAPLFDSTHVVDYQFVRNINSTADWETGARIIGSKQVYLNTTGAETNIDPNGWKYDYMNGWHTNASGISNYMCWMWKRHAGFDVVCWEGDGVAGRQISHSMNKTVEMIWVKDRSSSNGWAVGHKGLNGGTNPWEYNLKLNESAAEESYTNRWNDTAPTSTHFSVGTSNRVNTNGDDYIAMLFASVDGISKVGYFDGQDSTITITTGFQPRFLIVKRTTAAEGWYVLDTTRGWVTSGDDKIIELNSSSAQGDYVVGVPSSTGFTLTSQNMWNKAGHKYIYYCHA